MIPELWGVTLAGFAFAAAGAALGLAFKQSNDLAALNTKVDERTGVYKVVAEVTTEHAAMLVNHSAVIEELRGLVRALGSVPVAIGKLETMITGESNRLSSLMEAIARQKP